MSFQTGRRPALVNCQVITSSRGRRQKGLLLPLLVRKRFKLITQRKEKATDAQDLNLAGARACLRHSIARPHRPAENEIRCIRSGSRVFGTQKLRSAHRTNRGGRRPVLWLEGCLVRCSSPGPALRPAACIVWVMGRALCLAFV